ncbi:MAG: hypothetical protein ACM35H_06980 [Bacteroidota bacterium]
MTSGRAGSKNQRIQPRGVGRRAVVALGGAAAGGLAIALGHSAVARPAPDSPDRPQPGTDDGSRLTDHRAAYFKRARF